MEDVVALIGKPTSTEHIDVTGVTGTSAVWKTASAEIDIQFIDNRVAVKLFNQPHATS